jgi:type I restriction enzyme R subunit
MKHHSGAGEKFTEPQMEWLRMIRDHVINSFHIERDDLEMAPFNANGGTGKMWQLFGNRMDQLLQEMNSVLAA